MNSTATPKSSYAHFNEIWDKTSGEEIDKALAILADFSGYRVEAIESEFKAKIIQILNKYYGENGYLNYRGTLACEIGFLLYQLSCEELIHPLKYTEPKSQDSSYTDIEREPLFILLTILQEKTGVNAKPFIDKAERQYNWYQQVYIYENITKYNDWLQMMFQDIDKAFPPVLYSKNRDTKLIKLLKHSKLISDDEILNYFIANPHEKDPYGRDPYENDASLYALTSLNDEIQFDKNMLESKFVSALNDREYTLAFYLFCKAHGWGIDNYKINSVIDLLFMITNWLKSYTDNSFILKLIEHMSQYQSGEDSLQSRLVVLFRKMHLIKNWETVEEKIQEYLKIDIYDILEKFLASADHDAIRYLLRTKRWSISSNTENFWYDDETGKYGCKNSESKPYIKISFIQYAILASKKSGIERLSSLIDIFLEHDLACRHSLDTACRHSLDTAGRGIDWYFNQFKVDEIILRKGQALYREIFTQLIWVSNCFGFNINFNDVFAHLVEHCSLKDLEYLLENKKISLESSATALWFNEKTGKSGCNNPEPDSIRITPVQYAIVILQNSTSISESEERLIRLIQLFLIHDPNCINALDDNNRSASWYADSFIKNRITEKLGSYKLDNYYYEYRLHPLSRLFKIKTNLNEFFEKIINHCDHRVICKLIENDCLNLTTMTETFPYQEKSDGLIFNITPIQYIIIALRKHDNSELSLRLIIQHAHKNHPKSLDELDNVSANSNLFLKNFASYKLAHFPETIENLIFELNRIAEILGYQKDYLDITQFTEKFWFNENTGKYGHENPPANSIQITPIAYIILALSRQHEFYFSASKLEHLINHVKRYYPQSLESVDSVGNGINWYLEYFAKYRLTKSPDSKNSLFSYMDNIANILGSKSNYLDGIFWFNEQTGKCGHAIPESGTIQITLIQYIILALAQNNWCEDELADTIRYVNKNHPEYLSAVDSAGNDVNWYLKKFKSYRMETFPDRMKHLDSAMKRITVTLIKKDCMFDKDLNLFEPGKKADNLSANLQAGRAYRPK